MDYNQLLKKYFEGKCTDEELYVLYRNLQEGKLSDFDGLMNEIWEKLPDKLAMPEDKSEQVFKRIETEIEQRPAIPLYKKWAVYGIAASFVLILAAGVFFLNQEDVVEVTTAYQETKSVTLPDGTLINLNANSTLRYSEQLATQASREIWLEGEAFVNVTSRQLTNSAEKVPFIVHTDVVDIRVLGTQFNVKDRHGKAEIVLKEGKIRLSQSQNPQKQLDMEPGQKVLASSQSGLQISKVEDPALYTSWKDNEL